MTDPLTTLLVANEVPIDPPARFADALLDRCLHELRPRRRRRGLVVTVAFVAALVVAGAATATYFATHRSATPTGPTRGALTIIRPVGRNQLSTIAAVVDGRLRTIWRCPQGVWCGTLSSIAWSPDGKHLAMTLGEIGGLSGYVGLHVVDVATLTDHHVGVPAIAHPERSQPRAVLGRLVSASIAHLGCPLPFEVAWSPDSQRLAYVCGDDLLRGGAATRIYTIRADGSGRRRLPTGTRTAYWPSWSPDGKRIAFSTEPFPRLTYRCCSDDPVHHLRGTVYSVSVQGGARVLVAKNAAAPGYSPDGLTIAFETMCGVRSTPVGAAPFVAPLCPRWPTEGAPSWSPDGSTLAVGLRDGGVLLLTRDGRKAGSVANSVPGAPAWAPQSAVAPLLAPRNNSGY